MRRSCRRDRISLLWPTTFPVQHLSRMTSEATNHNIRLHSAVQLRDPLCWASVGTVRHLHLTGRALKTRGLLHQRASSQVSTNAVCEQHHITWHTVMRLPRSYLDTPVTVILTFYLRTYSEQHHHVTRHTVMWSMWHQTTHRNVSKQLRHVSSSTFTAYPINTIDPTKSFIVSTYHYPTYLKL